MNRFVILSCPPLKMKAMRTMVSIIPARTAEYGNPISARKQYISGISIAMRPILPI